MTKLLVFVLVTTFIAPIYVSAETEESEDNIKTSIIDRCRTQMGHMGASVCQPLGYVPGLQRAGTMVSSKGGRLSSD